MSEQDNTSVVRQAYENFGQGNIPGVLALLAETVQWRLPEMDGVPFAGERHGRDQVGRFFALLGETQEPHQFEPQQFIAQGDTVVALGRYTWRVKKTGRTFSSEWVHVFTIREGRIVAFREHLDTAAAVAAYR
jgi:ketosteroid isomerase-like protein